MLKEAIFRRLVYYTLQPYRVMRQDGDRVNLQPVNKSAPELPQSPAIDKAHGLQGAREVCCPSSLVLIGWQGGDPGSPYVAAYLDATPLEVEIDASTKIRLGANATRGVAREGDTVTVLLPPAMFTGTINGLPASGVVVWSPGQTQGTITTFSDKVDSE